jgi:hypothetical protein
MSVWFTSVSSVMNSTYSKWLNVRVILDFITNKKISVPVNFKETTLTILLTSLENSLSVKDK